MASRLKFGKFRLEFSKFGFMPTYAHWSFKVRGGMIMREPLGMTALEFFAIMGMFLIAMIVMTVIYYVIWRIFERFF